MDKKTFIDHFYEISSVNGRPIENKECAEIMGCSPSYSSKILDINNPAVPNVDHLANIAEYYNVSVDWLIGLDNKRIPDKWYGNYADILRFIVGIVDLEDLQCLSPEWEISVDVKNNNSTMICHDDSIANFFKEWVNKRSLYKDGIIDRHLYDLWLNDQLSFYAKQKPQHRHVSAAPADDDPSTFLNMDHEDLMRYAKTHPEDVVLVDSTTEPEEIKKYKEKYPDAFPDSDPA